jgi:predicted RNase H-like nuclease (RuvC/YqgF family)
MSTKKKVGISDLLRDEVQKETEAPVRNESTEQTIEVKAETIADTTSKVASRPELNAVEKTPSVSDRSLTDHTTAKISELERSLTQSRQREAELSQTVADLQKDLKFSHTNIELLQKSLAAIESLKNELDQQLVAVKRDNLRLAEANIQLSEHGKLAQPPVVEAASASQLVPQNPQNNRATPRKQPVEQPYPQRDRNPYARPTGSNEQLQRINNKNIGWMD